MRQLNRYKCQGNKKSPAIANVNGSAVPANIWYKTNHGGLLPDQQVICFKPVRIRLCITQFSVIYLAVKQKQFVFVSFHSFWPCWHSIKKLLGDKRYRRPALAQWALIQYYCVHHWQPIFDTRRNLDIQRNLGMTTQEDDMNLRITASNMSSGSTSQ